MDSTWAGNKLTFLNLFGFRYWFHLQIPSVLTLLSLFGLFTQYLCAWLVNVVPLHPHQIQLKVTTSWVLDWWCSLKDSLALSIIVSQVAGYYCLCQHQCMSAGITHWYLCLWGVHKLTLTLYLSCFPHLCLACVLSAQTPRFPGMLVEFRLFF